jgi:hypothetical protein
LRKRLGKVLEPKKEQLTGDWRELHYWEPHDLYCSQNIIQVMKFKKNEMCQAFGFYGGRKKNVCSVLVVKSEGK